MLDRLPYHYVICIDPGPANSGYVQYHCKSQKPEGAGAIDNHELRQILRSVADTPWTVLVYEQIACMGMIVGQQVFDSCHEMGRFVECFYQDNRSGVVVPVTRHRVKLAVCGNMRAKDMNIRASIIEMYGGKKKAVGLKKDPGPLYAVKSHAWSALALAKTLEREAHDERVSAATPRGGGDS